jgi:hypothetical protein
LEELLEISQEIREIISKKQRDLQLTFEEDAHKYTMLDSNGVLRSDFPSVSKVIKNYYNEFPKEEISLSMAKGDVIKQQILLNEWDVKATLSNHLGSRTHFLLEKYLLSLYGDYKTVRKPIFECNNEQIIKSNKMITTGVNYLDLLHERGAVLLDTEMILGDPTLGYTGQPDKVWLIKTIKNNIGILITDWKTNEPKNFLSHYYTKKMLKPFWFMDDTALSHYKIQLPLYGRLLLKMLENTKYSNLPLLGCVVVLLKEDRTFEEYKVPKNIIKTTFNVNYPPTPEAMG